ncbi:MAG: SAM-dependent methyltransferase [Planctomycetota bacterium]
MPETWPPRFLFAVCQCGAEQALKHEVAAGPIAARPAFSRPGFVTFKLDDEVAEPEQFQLPSTFARTIGFSLEKLSGDSTQELAAQLWRQPGVEALLAEKQLADLHVWQRDTAVPGVKGFEPGPTELALAVEASIRAAAPTEQLRAVPATPRQPSRRNRWVLDVVLVEPGEWWVGCHFTSRRLDSYAGGVMPIELPDDAVSRAYLKMEEALQWSALPIARGDLCVELGCAPGGASQALMEHGLRVLGVDPAEVDPQVIDSPQFTHIRRRSSEVAHKQLRGVQWVAADMNVAPTYTLDAVEQVVANDQAAVRGMILTLKLADWKLAAKLPELIARVRSWGYRDVRTRQLAFNRQEVCLVALRSRAQRRVKRARRRARHDAPHAGKAGPHYNSPPPPLDGKD